MFWSPHPPPMDGEGGIGSRTLVLFVLFVFMYVFIIFYWPYLFLFVFLSKTATFHDFSLRQQSYTSWATACQDQVQPKKSTFCESASFLQKRHPRKSTFFPSKQLSKHTRKVATQQPHGWAAAHLGINTKDRNRKSCLTKGCWDYR